MSLSGISISRSFLKSSDEEVKFPSAAQQATIYRWRDIGVFYPKMLADVKEVKVTEVRVSEEKVLVSEEKVLSVYKKKKKELKNRY